MTDSISIAEYAEKFGVHRNTVLYRIKKQRIAAVKVDGEWRIPVDEFQRQHRDAMTRLEGLNIALDFGEFLRSLAEQKARYAADALKASAQRVAAADPGTKAYREAVEQLRRALILHDNADGVVAAQGEVTERIILEGRRAVDDIRGAEATWDGNDDFDDEPQSSDAASDPAPIKRDQQLVAEAAARDARRSSAGDPEAG